MREKQKCKTCQFYKANSGIGSEEYPLSIGLCQLKPPVMVKSNETHRSESRWPSMRENDSCGEWEPREVEPKEVEPRKGGIIGFKPNE